VQELFIERHHAKKKIKKYNNILSINVDILLFQISNASDFTFI